MIKEDLTVWNDLKTPLPHEFLTFVADEVWRRTRAPFFLAERAKLELAIVKATTPDERQRILSALITRHESELEECRHLSALVSQALIETAAEGYEAWCRAAMARLKLAPLSDTEADQYLTAVRSAKEEMLHLAPALSSDGVLTPARPAA